MQALTDYILKHRQQQQTDRQTKGSLEAYLAGPRTKENQF